MRRVIVLIIVLIGFTESIFPGALDEYSQACVNGDSNSCYQLAIAYRDGDIDNGVRQNTVAAKQFLEIACDSGSTRACSELNTKEEKYNNLSMNTLEIKDSRLLEYKKACDQGDGSACYELGLLYEKGEVVKKNQVKADQFFLRACDLHDDRGCLTMAAYWEINHNMKKAMEYYIEVCERSGGMCEYIALWYEAGGDGLDQDLEKAKKYYQKDCAFGNKDSCKKVEELSFSLRAPLLNSLPNHSSNHQRKTVKLKHYTNVRFGFTLIYPTDQFVTKKLSDNGDGITLYNSDKSLELKAYGSWYGENIRQVYRDEQGWAKDAGQKVTYKVLKKNWFVLSGMDRKKQTIFYLKTYFREGKSVSFRLEYPVRDKVKYNSLVSMINKNFKAE